MSNPLYDTYKNLRVEEIAPRMATRLSVEIIEADLERFAQPIGDVEALVEIAKGASIFGMSAHSNSNQSLFVIFNEGTTISDYSGRRSEQISQGGVEKLPELSRWALANMLYILENPNVPQQMIPID